MKLASLRPPRAGWLCLLALAASAACADREAAPQAAPAASSPLPWPPPPEAYDCRATAEPARVSPVPANCVADRACKQRMICGHRGAGGDLGKLTPENTVSGVRAAIAYGIEMVETDPRPSKDGVLVNVHDTDVSRIADARGEVADMTLEELRALPLKTAKYSGDFSCERIATIEEILVAARGKVHVLLDANKTDQIATMVSLVQKTDTLDWAVIDTDSPEKIEQALAIEPRLLTMIRVSEPDELDAELKRFAAHPPVLVEIRDKGDPKTLVPLIHAAGHRAFTDAFVVDFSAGLADDPSLYDSTWALGLDALQTDRIDLVLRNQRPR